MTRGKFITLEGVDGAGKSTHMAYVAARLESAGRTLLRTREPGGTPAAERLREVVIREPLDPLSEALIMFAARADHVARVIRPAIESGQWVLCDRFTAATIAYQGAGKGVSLELIGRLASETHDDVRPDLTVVFDCPYELAFERLLAKRAELDRFENEGRPFFERVRGSYLDQARADPDRMRIVDASRPIDEIRRDLDRLLDAL